MSLSVSMSMTMDDDASRWDAMHETRYDRTRDTRWVAQLVLA